ncbi:hypothetical protein HK097_005633, partial [Rhizophlyctis rosea]
GGSLDEVDEFGDGFGVGVEGDFEDVRRSESSALLNDEQELLASMNDLSRRFEDLVPAAEAHKASLEAELAKWTCLTTTFERYVTGFTSSTSPQSHHHTDSNPYFPPLDTIPQTHLHPARSDSHSIFHFEASDMELHSPGTPQLFPGHFVLPQQGLMIETPGREWSPGSGQHPKTAEEEMVGREVEGLEERLRSGEERVQEVARRNAKSHKHIQAMVSALDELSEQVNEEWARKLKAINEEMGQLDSRPDGGGFWTEIYYQILAYLLACLGFTIWSCFQIAKLARPVLRGVRVISPRTANALVEAGAAAKEVVRAAAVAGRDGGKKEEVGGVAGERRESGREVGEEDVSGSSLDATERIEGPGGGGAVDEGRGLSIVE